MEGTPGLGMRRMLRGGAGHRTERREEVGDEWYVGAVRGGSSEMSLSRVRERVVENIRQGATRRNCNMRQRIMMRL